MDSVVHFEIPVDDEGRAKEFYNDVFGWRVDSMPEMNYTMLYTTDSDEQTGMPSAPGSINGGMFRRRDNPELTQPVITIGVDSLEDALELVRTHGGSQVGDISEVPDMGRGAYVHDPEGNVIGLWQDTTAPT
ncbi:MAG: Glyoxalase/bleomycin resistance protein/dioxygenase [Thermoleophilia bacterium]|jgi:predicted enzyme related to lactoylglutathione lyase|nr:Glyoxalase/bleomycin resistance protein/dioxygenase [Thermoleophilia bacterium]